MIKEFDLHLYPVTLWIAVNPSDKDFEQFDFDLQLSEIPLDGYADTLQIFSQSYEKNGILIRFEDIYALTTPIITHESTHAANYVYEIIGANNDLDNDEPYAYLCEYIAKCCESMKN